MQENKPKQTSEVDLIDFAILRSLAELSSPEDDSLLLELTQLFSETTPELLLELRKAIEDGRTDAAARVAHRLKGSAANIGATQMAATCSVLEKSGRDNTIDDNLSLWNEISFLFNRSCNEIFAWISTEKQKQFLHK